SRLATSSHALRRLGRETGRELLARKTRSVVVGGGGAFGTWCAHAGRGRLATMAHALRRLGRETGREILAGKTRSVVVVMAGVFGT
ncbi:hypothetical protein ACIBG0_39375, partial [Nocardia sp. NPDC050630]|uniref:hypothetical protein n=1 Tax=Nocardia sp. NPDC050630 TaxID=3364321 RepID=UPI0037BDF364